MKTLRLGICVALMFAPSGLFDIARAQQQKAQTKDALYEQCKRAVYRKYGQRAPEWEGKKVRILSSQFVQAFDQCVASQGKSF